MQGKRGGLKDTLPDDMLAAVFTATLERTGINPAVSISSPPPFSTEVATPIPSHLTGTQQPSQVTVPCHGKMTGKRLSTCRLACQCLV